MIDIDDKILEMYERGSELGTIIETQNITHKHLMLVLKRFVENNKNKNGTYTDDIKKVIASRDRAGVTRGNISFELGININTVRSACEKFGKPRKKSEGQIKNQLFVRIGKGNNFDKCPLCKSSKVNEVEIDEFYCIDCGNEFRTDGNHIYKLNWDMVD